MKDYLSISLYSRWVCTNDLRAVAASSGQNQEEPIQVCTHMSSNPWIGALYFNIFKKVLCTKSYQNNTPNHEDAKNAEKRCWKCKYCWYSQNGFACNKKVCDIRIAFQNFLKKLVLKPSKIFYCLALQTVFSFFSSILF